MSQAPRRVATLLLDVDSTLAGIEGIDWLALRRGPAVEAQVRAETESAMAGRVPLDSVYGSRLAIVRPTRADVAALAEAYLQARAPLAAAVLGRLQARGVRCVIISGGVREAILPLAASVGIAASDVHAVSLHFTANGEYAGFDEASPLTRRGGKPVVAAGIPDLQRPVVAVGDGDTDAELDTVVDEFWAFTGFAARAPVVARARLVVQDFAAIERLVFA